MPVSQKSIPGRNLVRGEPEDTVLGSNTVDPSGFIKTTQAGTGATEFLTREVCEPVYVRFTVANRSGGAADSVILFNANLPWKCRLLDFYVLAKEAETSETVKLTDGSNDLCGAIAVSTDKALTRVAVLEHANITLAKGSTVRAVFAGGTDRPACDLVLVLGRIV